MILGRPRLFLAAILLFRGWAVEVILLSEDVPNTFGCFRPRTNGSPARLYDNDINVSKTLPARPRN